MSRSFIMLLLAAAMAPGLSIASTDDADKGEQVGHHVYIVVFDEPAVAAFQGFDPEHAHRPKLAATSPVATRQERFDPKSAAAVAYSEYLDELRAARMEEAAQKLARPVEPEFIYRYALNGMAVAMDANEAAELARMPGVKRVQREQVLEPATDRGPTWIRATQIWDGSATGVGRRGEGVVVGIIDTGIRATHMSFAATSPLDGYVHSNPRGSFLGNVDTPKNNKLIGIWDFTTGTGDNEVNDGSDVSDHGTHVASTAAGNAVNFGSLQATGVAPRANIISYKSCEVESQCRGAWTLAALEQAVADQVDVINYSLGSGPRDPWASLGGTVDDTMEAMLVAREAGIVVAAAATNAGPELGTVGSPANAPWVLAVAAATHDRALANSLTGLSGGASPAPAGGTLTGAGNVNLATGLSSRQFARDPAFPFCATGDDPGSINPNGQTLPPGWNSARFPDRIVVCERATEHSVGYARREMAYNVQQAGGVGIVLLNQDSDGLSTVSDTYPIPMVHLSAADSRALRTWLAAGSGHAGGMSGTSFQVRAEFGDRLAPFSSRGPVEPLGVVKPDLAAPGVGILAASRSADDGAALFSGTSMAAPHVTGAVALLRSVRPALSPSQITSALVLTARDSLILMTEAAANAHEQGAGMIDVARAAQAGLYLEATGESFRSASASATDGLNVPALGHDRCFETCTLRRSFRLMPGVTAGNYAIEASLPAGVVMTASVGSLSITGGGSRDVDFVFDVAAAAGRWVYGKVTLRNTSGDGRPNLSLPVAIYASPGDLPQPVSRTVATERGAFDLPIAGLTAFGNARYVATDLVEPTVDSPQLLQDLTRNDPYDNLDQVFHRLITIPASPASGPIEYQLRIATTSEAPDVDLFVGIDLDGDGLPSAAEQRCISNGPDSNEECSLTIRSRSTPHHYWALAQVWDGGGSAHPVRIESSLVPLVAGDPRKLRATGPGRTTSRQAFALRVGYDDPGFLNGQRRVGYLLMQPSPGHTSTIVPIVLTRDGDGFAPFALADGQAHDFVLPGLSAHELLYFDVPPHVTSVRFSTESSGAIDLYLARVDHSEHSAQSTIGTAPPRNQANASATTSSGSETITLSGQDLPPGRWYVTPDNRGGGTATGRVKVEVLSSNQRPAFRSGHYFNPARSGHGAFVDFAGPDQQPDHWVMVWYSYLEDGSPTWYYAQGGAPADTGIWRVPLYRVVWNGSATHGTSVGDINIAELGQERLSFSFNLDGVSGSETMTRLGDAGCLAFNGEDLDVTGHWYSPSLPGFGYSYQLIPGNAPQEVFISYLYDGNGFPRWVYGQRDFDPNSSTLPLYWLRGFCPTCPAIATTTHATGTGTRVLASNDINRMGADVSFTAPLSGQWNENRPTERLSARKFCR